MSISKKYSDCCHNRFADIAEAHAPDFMLVKGSYEVFKNNEQNAILDSYLNKKISKEGLKERMVFINDAYEAHIKLLDKLNTPTFK